MSYFAVFVLEPEEVVLVSLLLVLPDWLQPVTKAPATRPNSTIRVSNLFIVA